MSVRLLHLGCGYRRLGGFVNIDNVDYPAVDLQHDLTKPLPYLDNTVDGIYSEHFIEHITMEECLRLFSECLRVLKPGGIIRSSTPDLDYVIYSYFNHSEAVNAHWTSIATWGKSVPSKSFLFNMAFTCWGHRYIYNYSELKKLLETVGFKDVKKVEFQKSSFRPFEGIDYRENSLIVEAVKPEIENLIY
ncbi:MAG: methyltransferase domain-containing protein [Deltaproteobacteria bacterium]|nr:methyltransferase domain-containing protein [Deltaproteobacteria bacterium]